MRTNPHSSLLILLLSLSGCTQATMPAQSQAGQSVPTTSPAPPSASEAGLSPACPDADFAAFLKRFEGSVSVQRTATADPLKIDAIDAGADPEPRQVTRQVALSDVEFPVIADAKKRQSEGLEQSVSEPGPDRREVTHAIPDSDAQIRFEFRADPCWKLVRVSNDTI